MPTIEELDAEFDKKLAELNKGTDEEEVEDKVKPVVQPKTETQDEVVDEEEEPEETVTPEVKTTEVKSTKKTPTGDEEFQTTKPTEEQKRQFAFDKMRKELAQEKAEKAKFVKMQEETESLARNLGYKDADEMLKAERKKRIDEEAVKQGIKPEFYQELVQLKDEVKQLKVQKEEQQKQSATQRFATAMNETVKEFALTDEEKSEIFQALAEDGYTVDMLTSNPQPKKLLKGYIPEGRIVEKTKQTVLADKTKFKEPAHKNTPSETEDEKYARALDEDMANYASRNGYPYERKFKK